MIGNVFSVVIGIAVAVGVAKTVIGIVGIVGIVDRTGRAFEVPNYRW